jgi:acetoin utilization deacetylase AcuC-like enzyme
MTHALTEIADCSARGRLMMLLEGGYDLNALVASVSASVHSLRSPQSFSAPDGELTSWGRLSRSALAPYWDRI